MPDDAIGYTVFGFSPLDEGVKCCLLFHFILRQQRQEHVCMQYVQTWSYRWLDNSFIYIYIYIYYSGCSACENIAHGTESIVQCCMFSTLPRCQFAIIIQLSWMNEWMIEWTIDWTTTDIEKYTGQNTNMRSSLNTLVDRTMNHFEYVMSWLVISIEWTACSGELFHLSSHNSKSSFIFNSGVVFMSKTELEIRTN